MTRTHCTKPQLVQ